MHAFQRIFLLFLTVFAQFLTGCAQGQDVNDSLSFIEQTAEPKGVGCGGSTPAVTVHLPFPSGDDYGATTYSGHGNAWDFADPTDGVSDCGRPVAAAADGIVSKINTSCTTSSGTSCGGQWGNYVQINDDDDAYYTRYAHLNSVFVVAGQWVRQGQVIGTVGQTGNASGCHLHFQVENSTGTSSYLASYYYFDGTSRVSDCLTATTGSTKYTSYNAGVFEDTRDSNGGTSVVGTSSPKIASQPDNNGFSKSYVGGSLGDTTIYYEALGFTAGSYNNTNQTWLLQGNMRTYYYSCGGPASCFLGYPTGQRTSYGSGWRQTFRCGYLIESASGAVTAYSYTCG